jgi:hypothetical protein
MANGLKNDQRIKKLFILEISVIGGALHPLVVFNPLG